MKRTVEKLALYYLAALALVVWGFGIGRYDVFPAGVIEEVFAFVAGDPSEDTTVVEKLWNDAGLRPERFLHNFPVAKTSDFRELRVRGLKARRVQPLVYLSDEAPRGYRVVLGALDLEDSLWGALAIDPQGQVVHTWRLSTDHLPGSMAPEHGKNMYGVSVGPDGSIAFLMQERGGGIVKVDLCSRVVWNREGVFHHSITPTDSGELWTYAGPEHVFDHMLARLDADTGEVNTVINMEDVRKRNPDAHIFDLQRQPNVADAVHGNDVEELSSALAPHFPGFEAGDLLLSYRTTNLVFVIDPDTLEIKWWRIGPWDRQHDPDWNANGEITVYSNNERGVGNFSKIISIDPATMDYRVLVDGAHYDFYSSINGNHQVTEHGTILVTSSTQGRVFEVDQHGERVFEFINSYSHENQETLRVSGAFFLEPDFFDFEEFPTCR